MFLKNEVAIWQRVSQTLSVKSTIWEVQGGAEIDQTGTTSEKAVRMLVDTSYHSK